TDLAANGYLDIHDRAWHRRSDAALMGRARPLAATGRCRNLLFGGAAAAFGHFDLAQRLDQDFLGYTINRYIVGSLVFARMTAAGQSDMESFAMQRDVEFIWCITCIRGCRCVFLVQRFRLQGTAIAFLQEGLGHFRE